MLGHEMALERLEPCAMKVARTTLWRIVTGDSHGLSDTTGLQPRLRRVKAKTPIKAANNNQTKKDKGTCEARLIE